MTHYLRKTIVTGSLCTAILSIPTNTTPSSELYFPLRSPPIDHAEQAKDAMAWAGLGLIVYRLVTSNPAMRDSTLKNQE